MAERTPASSPWPGIAAAALAALLALADSARAQAPRVLASTVATEAYFEGLDSACIPSADVCLHVWRALDPGRGLATAEGEVYALAQSLADPALQTGAYRLSEMGGVGDARWQARSPALATLNDRFLVVWIGEEPGVSGRRVYLRTVSATSGGAGVLHRVSEQAFEAGSGAVLDDRAPAIGCRPQQRDCLVVWARYTRPGELLSAEIHGRVVDADGRILGGEFRVSGMGAASGPDRYASAPRLAYLAGADRYLVAWDGRRAEADGHTHGYAASVPGPGGNASPTVRSTSGSGEQRLLAPLALPGDTRALLAWDHDDDTVRVAPWDATPAPVGASQGHSLHSVGTLSWTLDGLGQPLLASRRGQASPAVWVLPVDSAAQARGPAREVLRAAQLPEGTVLRGAPHVHAVDPESLRVVALVGPAVGASGTMHLISHEDRHGEFAFADGFE